VEFGLDRLRAEWAILCADPLVKTARARPIVARCLRHIEEGFSDAASRNPKALERAAK